MNGLLVKVGDVLGLAEALTRLLGDGELRRRMGAAAQAKVQHYSLNRVLAEMREVYAHYIDLPEVE